MFKQRIEKFIHLPLHKHLGVEYTSSSKGEGSLNFIVADHMVNASGVLHGGVIYTILDACAYAGLLSVLPDDQEAVTHDIHISVLRPGRVGDRVEINSKLIKMGRTLCFFEVSAQVNGTIIARATITKSLIKRVTG